MQISLCCCLPLQGAKPLVVNNKAHGCLACCTTSLLSVVSGPFKCITTNTMLFCQNEKWVTLQSFNACR